MSAARRALIPALLPLFLAACGNGEERAAELPAAVSFERAPALVVTETDTLEIGVEIAGTDVQRRQGLMERRSLAPDSGMVFTYAAEQPADAGFWMFRTRIPLDIAYYDAEGRIVRILRMEPCPSPYGDVCRTYPPGVPYHGALEMNAGWFAEHGVGVGDRIIPPDGPGGTVDAREG